MSSLRRTLLGFGRWPRRIAALVCLLLAAGSAVAPHAPAKPAGSLGLRRGEVAVPVSVQSAASVAPGQYVGVLAAASDSGQDAALVADRLRVLSIHTGLSGLAGDGSTVVTVATDRASAVELARYADRTLLMITDKLP